MKGEAEAFAIEAKAKAEAEQMAKKADAWKEYREAAVVDMVLATMPKVCHISILWCQIVVWTRERLLIVLTDHPVESDINMTLIDISTTWAEVILRAKALGFFVGLYPSSQNVSWNIRLHNRFLLSCFIS